MRAPKSVTSVQGLTFEALESRFLLSADPIGVAVPDATDAADMPAALVLDAQQAIELPSISVSNATVTEGNTSNTFASFNVTLSAPSQTAVMVDFTTSDGTAQAGTDYVTVDTTLFFQPGETTRRVFVTVRGDLTAEGNETFHVTLSNPDGAVLGNAQGLGTIVDDDAAPRPSVSVGDATAVEGNDGTTNAVFNLSLSAPSTQAVTVDYFTQNASAIAGIDYVAAVGSVTFAPGETGKQIAVALIGDSLDEFDETFLVGLSGASNGTIADGQAAGTIVDDDPEAALSISDAVLTEGTGGDQLAEFVVSLSSASAKTVTVQYGTADGTALAGSDYVAAAGQITFVAGETSKRISVFVSGDDVDEADETFSVLLSDAQNGTIADGSAAGTIVDDDEAPNVAPEFVQLGQQTVEEGRELRFVVQANDADDAADTLTFTVGPLPAGASFDAATREFVWAPVDDQSTSVTFTVTDPDGAQDVLEVALVATNAPSVVDAGADQVVGLQSVNDDDCGDGRRRGHRPEAEVSIAAVFDDFGLLDTHTATIDWGDGHTSDGSVVEPTAAADGSVKGTHTYTMAGKYTVTVTVRDDDGGVRSDQVIVEVKKPVEKRNFEARADAYTLNEDTVLRVTAAQGVLANDRKPGAAMQARLVEGPEHGSLVFNADGSFVYTPSRDYHGKDSFWYEFTDQHNVSRAVEVVLTVKDVRDKPHHHHGHHHVDWQGGWKSAWSDGFRPFGKHGR